jgi:rhomboid protease GluP
MRAETGGGFWGIDVGTLLKFGAKYGGPGFIDLYLPPGQWWRLVTAGFLHGGMLHILMNCWVLFDLAPQVEEIYGASRMWVIYLLSSVGGFYLSNLLNPLVPSVGASAALCGLIGAMISIGVQHRDALGDAIRSTYIRWAIYILIFSVLVPHVDIWAHIGGGLAGFGIAYVAGTPRLEGSAVERLWLAAAWACLALTGISFALWYLWFSHTA